jgi:uncharacterized membrane protein YhhN
VTGSRIAWLMIPVCAAFALVDWYAVWRGNRRTETWAKPAVLVTLVLVALALDAAGSTPGIWLVAGLVLGLAGDVLLLGDSDTRFRLGLAAFLVGHLAYVVCFATLGLPAPVWAWGSAVVLTTCLVVTRDVVPATHRRGGAALSVPVAVYTAVIAAMLVLAWCTGHALIALGATVFAASDSVLAVDRFVRPRDWAHVVVMVTYHVGQALIVAGVLAAA